MKKALVCGAGGFIAGHLVKKLKQEGYYVCGVDIKEPEFGPTEADEFTLLDLRYQMNCALALRSGFDEVYQLAADFGGMGYIEFAECEIMKNNVLINTHMLNRAKEKKVPKYFFSSSVCVHSDMSNDASIISEKDAYPAHPDNEYGFEKLYSERMALAYGRNYSIKTKVARFQNCYGEKAEWQGGREKAPAAICRKVAQAKDGDTIEVWGDGTAIRGYTYVDDLVNGIYTLMQSDEDRPTNIGSDERISVTELVQTVIEISGKELYVKYVEGPVGVQARNFSKERMKALGWETKTTFKEGIAKTYGWIEKQIGLCNKP